MDDEDAARASRVMLVSSRRRPSSGDISDVDTYPPPYFSSSSSTGSGWRQSFNMQRTTPLPRTKSGDQEDERYSLPTLESARSFTKGGSATGVFNPQASIKDMMPRRTGRERGAARTGQPHHDVEDDQANTNAATPAGSMHGDSSELYFAPNSPPGISSKSHKSYNSAVRKDRTRSAASHPATVVTEVGVEPYTFAQLTRAAASANKTTSHSSKDHVLDLTADTPHVTIEETQKYTFAIILKHTDQVFKLLRQRFPSKSAASIRRDLPFQVSQLQQKCLRRLIQAGLGVVLLDNDIYDPQDRDDDDNAGSTNICILIDPKQDKDLLLHEFKREMDELSIKQGDSISKLGEESLDSLKELCFSPALELQLTHNIIYNAITDYDKEEWVSDVNKELTVKDVILECFPLHDRTFNKKFFAEYRKRTLDWNPRRAAVGNMDRWVVEELRLHFGERVAFLFAFMNIYTKHLMPLTAICVTFYLCLRFLQGYVWSEYVQGMGIMGFCVACFWGPSFLVCWARETSILVEKWNLAKYKNTVFENNDSNPDFQYVWAQNHLTKEMEKIPKQRKNHWIQLTMLFFVLLSAIVQCICLVPFIQWYVYAKNAPQCSVCYSTTDNTYTCIWFVTCFNSENSALGTDRWVYILVQGILLGLLIDIIFFEVFNWLSEKFVRWENYAKKSDHENRLIHRRFVFVWSNWFFWFLFLAFVYLPFGDTFLRYVRRIGLGALAPYQWDAGLLTLDTMFVTPLVVTQFLNMVLETLLPYVMRKLRGRPVVCRRASPFTACLSTISRCFKSSKKVTTKKDDEPNDSKPLTARILAGLVKQRTHFNVQVLPVSDDCNQYSAYEVIAESKLTVFDPMLDYLDACIQFSYVVMFTAVWPLLPLPAFINNILEVRGDAFRLLYGHRRPMPRRDTSIGEWATVLSYANIIGVTVVMGFLVVYHGGYFVTSCNFTFSYGDLIPFGSINATYASDPETCADENMSGTPRWMMWQVGLFVLLEHIGFCLRYLVLQIEKIPSAIRSSGYQRLKQIQRLTHTRSAPSPQFEYVQKLKELFEKHDLEGDGHLREPELVAFLSEWLCKHPSELMPCSGIIFRYMDKNCLGRVPFATCCLMLQHVNHDRFFSCLLGLYDPLNGPALNEHILRASDALELRRVMSQVSSVVSERRSSMASMASMSMSGDTFMRPRDSTFFYVAPTE